MTVKMRRVLTALGVTAAALSTGGFAAGGAGRTKGYFALYRSAYTHAPSSLHPVFALADFLMNPVFEKAGVFEPVWMEVRPGIKMQLDPYDMVSRNVLETGEWEPGSIRAVAEHLSARGTFIDVGAHIGYYSLQAAAIVGANGHVLSIEPNPQTLPKLRGNIQASDARMVSVWPVACADKESTLQFYAAPETNTGESSFSKENASQEGAAAVSYSVQARPLDAIVREAKLDRIDVIKIDVEGAEYQVINGAVKTLEEFRPVLIIELVPDQLKSMGSSMEQVTQFLKAHGYPQSRRVDAANYEFVPAKASAGIPAN